MAYLVETGEEAFLSSTSASGRRSTLTRRDVVRQPAEVEPDEGSRYWVRAVDRTVGLLEAIAESGRDKTLAEVARHAGMPEPSALRYLATLSARGLVERHGTGEQSRYRLGLGAFVLAERAVGNPDIRSLALPFMQTLLDRYQETVNLAVFRQRRLVIIEVLEGLRSIRQGARVGEQDRLRSTALGKAVLASYSDKEALALARAEPAVKRTANTITTDTALLKELSSVRARGYSVDNEEDEVGLRCIGVAIRGPHGEPLGLSISGPSQVFSAEVVRDAGPVLCQIAGELSSRLAPGRARTRAPQTNAIRK
jgi:IclR family acetate operon transcriptional repressor